MNNRNRQITLAARPVGLLKESDFRMIESPLPRPGKNEFLIRIIYLSVDPYMRNRMNDRPSYAPSVSLDGVMVGSAVGQVLESFHPSFPKGTIVEGYFGWQEYALSNGELVRVIDPSIAPISTALGVLGMPGFTAYFGLLDICQPKSGETVLVSGAAGAVGMLVGQIAKIRGCRVVGVAGSDEKVAYITQELGFDTAFNYKTSSICISKLEELCPQGIDVYFDNVGGPLTDAAFLKLNVGARIAICGQISQYNQEKSEMGPRLLWQLIVKRARVQGFLVFDYIARYPEAAQHLVAWLKAGKIKYRETVVEGIENAPKALIGLFQGENIGKQIVKVSEI